MRLAMLLFTFASAPEAARINKAIELLAQGQPVYYTTSRGGYEEGKALAQTWADYINYELEHGAFDVTKLREFMQGLVDGGPTPSGHRTPAVIATIPALGLDEAMMRANGWVVQQVLAAGVHASSSATPARPAPWARSYKRRATPFTSRRSATAWKKDCAAAEVNISRRRSGGFHRATI